MKSGILILDKPFGMTSRAVDNAVGKIFQTRKVGHLGTLDPFATGLLVVSVGQGGKFLPFLGGGKKTYEARLVLGEKTSTGDIEGEVIERKEVPPLSEGAILCCLKEFLGKREQIPPMTSAIKVGGTALYELARKGIEVARQPRPIEIYSIRPLSREGNVLSFEAEVSEGTYIRVLGEEIAEALGTVGHLEALRRTNIGKFKIQEAIPLSEVKEGSIVDPSKYVDLPRVVLNEADAKKARNGMSLPIPSEEGRLLLSDGEKAIAIYEKEGSVYRCLRGLL